MCLYPRLIMNRKFTANKKNGGIIPPVLDKRTLYVPKGCGNCRECRKQKAREWQVRMMYHIKQYRNGKFITLTFSNESIKELRAAIINQSYIDENKILQEDNDLNGDRNKRLEKCRSKRSGYGLDNAIATEGVRRFCERWRKKFKNMKNLKHWLITELGHNGTENIHLHGIIWTNESYDTIRERWGYGYIWPRDKRGEQKAYVSERTINYIIKYVTKIDRDHKYYKAKILSSPGIGKGFENTLQARLNKYNDNGTIETYRTTTGHEIAMPVYWRNKIYSEEEREKLWIEKLDKETRWVNGIEIDISKNLDEYYRVLQYEQKRSHAMGFGDDKVNWEIREYEEQRRNLLMEKRISS